MSFPTTTEITTAKNSTYTSGTDIATGYYFANTEDPSPVAKIRGFLKAFIDLIIYNENDVSRVVNHGSSVRAFRDTAINFPPGKTKIVFNVDTNADNTIAYDIGNNYDTSNGRYTAPYSGFYNVSGQFNMSGSAAGTCFICLVKNNNTTQNSGGGIARIGYTINTGGDSINGSTVIRLSAGDYIEFFADVSPGGAHSLALGTGRSDINYMTINYLGNI
jgi:hypothetical protein